MIIDSNSRQTGNKLGSDLEYRKESICWRYFNIYMSFCDC